MATAAAVVVVVVTMYPRGGWRDDSIASVVEYARGCRRGRRCGRGRGPGLGEGTEVEIEIEIEIKIRALYCLDMIAYRMVLVFILPRKIFPKP